MIDPETRQPKVRRRQGSIRAFLTLIVLVALSTGSIVLAHYWKEELRVERVFVTGSRIVSATDIVAASKIATGMSMYDLDLRTVEKNILAQLYVKSAIVVRELPDALHIYVLEREPLTALSIDRLIYIDDESVALPQHPASAVFDVPLITGVSLTEQIVPGKTLMRIESLRAVALLKYIRDNDQDLFHLISEVNADAEGNFVLYSLEAGVPIKLGKEVNVEKLAMLKTFWQEFVMPRGAEQLRLVDLRFEDQVIARWLTKTAVLPKPDAAAAPNNNSAHTTF